jgi:hypothetical protein
MSFDPNKVPPHIGYYLAGFTDGEGSFNISFRPRSDYTSGWKISPCFNVSNKDKVILTVFKQYLQCGTLRARPDGVWYYEVNNIQMIIDHVVPFFKRFAFLSSKKKNDFSKFQQILDIILTEKPVSKGNIEKIITLRNLMNGGGKRKYSDEEIRARLSF